jgi:hypothetical protein
MARPPNSIEIICPDCKSVLVVDLATGGVLEHKPEPKGKSFGSLEEALSSMKSADSARDDRFRASVEAEKKRAEVLSAQFEHLVKKAEEEGGPPPKNPLDLD